MSGRVFVFVLPRHPGCNSSGQFALLETFSGSHSKAGRGPVFLQPETKKKKKKKKKLSGNKLAEIRTAVEEVLGERNKKEKRARRFLAGK